jgi:integrase
MARRHFQTGCLTKKGRSWVFRYREYQIGADGTVQSVHRSVSLGAIKRQEAIRASEDIQREQSLRGERPKAAMTLREFWENHFEPQIIRKKRTNTRKAYAVAFNKHIRPAFGEKKLCDITRFEVQQFISQKQTEGYSPQTIAHFRELLSAGFRAAELWGWVDGNPCRGVTLPQMRRLRTPRVLSLEEIDKVWKELREPARTIFALGVSLGLRIGEALGLKVEDVDLQAGTLCVKRSVCRGEEGPTKTPQSTREYPLPAQIVDLLNDYLAQRKVESEWLFPTEVGTFHNDRNLYIRYLEPAIKNARVPCFSWHSMRHTFLTYNGQRVSMPILQALVGHTKAQTTLKYIRTFEHEKRAALDVWAHELFPNCSRTGQKTPPAKNVAGGFVN